MKPAKAWTVFGSKQEASSSEQRSTATTDPPSDGVASAAVVDIPSPTTIHSFEPAKRKQVRLPNCVVKRSSVFASKKSGLQAWIAGDGHAGRASVSGGADGGVLSGGVYKDGLHFTAGMPGPQSSSGAAEGPDALLTLGLNAAAKANSTIAEAATTTVLDSILLFMLHLDVLASLPSCSWLAAHRLAVAQPCERAKLRQQL